MCDCQLWQRAKQMYPPIEMPFYVDLNCFSQISIKGGYNFAWKGAAINHFTHMQAINLCDKMICRNDREGIWSANMWLHNCKRGESGSYLRKIPQSRWKKKMAAGNLLFKK